MLIFKQQITEVFLPGKHAAINGDINFQATNQKSAL